MTIRTTIVRMLAVTASAWAIGGNAYAEIARFSAGEQRGWQGDGRNAQVAEQWVEWRAAPGRPRAEQERLAGLSPEQRQQMRQQMREHWQQMPQDQRDRQGQQQRWQNPPEDRRQFREERREIREERNQQRGWNRGEGRGRQ